MYVMKQYSVCSDQLMNDYNLFKYPALSCIQGTLRFFQKLHIKINELSLPS